MKENIVLEFVEGNKLEHVAIIETFEELFEWIDKLPKAKKAILSLIEDDTNRNRASYFVWGGGCIAYLESFYISEGLDKNLLYKQVKEGK